MNLRLDLRLILLLKKKNIVPDILVILNTIKYPVNIILTSKSQTREKLMEVYSKVESILKDRYGNCLLKELEYSYNIGFYNINNEEKVIYYINNFEDLIGISGKIKSVIGEILLLTDAQNRLIAFNSKLMLGRVIDIDEQVDSNIVPVSHLKKIVHEKAADNLTLF